MRVIVCGSPHYRNRDFIFSSLDRVHRKGSLSYLIREDERGVSQIAGEWAQSRLVGSICFAKARAIPGSGCPIDQMFSDSNLGRPDALIAFVGDEERETKIINRALASGLKVWRPECPL